MGGSDLTGLVAASPTGLLLVRDGVVAQANTAAASEIGVDVDDLVGHRLEVLVCEADRSSLAGALRAAGEGERTDPVAAVDGVIEHHGTRCPVAFTFSAIGGDLLVGVRSRRHEVRLEAIIDALAERTMLLNTAGLVEWQSAGLAASFSDPESGIGINPIERVHPEDLPLVLDAFAHAVNNPGRVVRAEARSHAIDDDEVWQRVEIIGASKYDHPDINGIIVQVRALDDGEVVESVGETGGEFMSLADAAPIGIVVDDAFGRTVYRNRAARAILGESEQGSQSYWLDRARPEFRPSLERIVQTATLEGDEGAATVAFDVADGQMRWLRVHVTPRFSEGRQSIGLITTLEDVSAEVEARAEAERLKQMFDATSDFVSVMRPGGEVLYVNAATRRLLDALREEGAEGRLRDLIVDDMRHEWVEGAARLMERGDTWEGEVALNGGGGRRIPVSMLAVIRRNPDGTPDWIAVHARDISDRMAVEEQLRETATHDHLTGLPNRPLFNDRLEQAVARHKRDHRGVAVMFCDLDGFKAINDDHGHAAGDHVLVTIAERLRTVTRETDTPARVGGDEFVVVCEGINESEDVAPLAKRVIDAVAEPIELPSGETVRVGISVGIGVARARQREVDPDRLLTLADTAMYRAKARGGNGYRISALESPPADPRFSRE